MSVPDGEVVRWEKAEGSDRVEILDLLSADEDSNHPNNEDVKCLISTKAGGKPKTPCFMYIIVFFAIIGGFLFGYDTGVIAGALLELDRDYPLDTTKKELIVSITLVAAAVGALLGGPLNEKLGRKKTIMVASVVFAAGAVVMGVAPSPEWGWTVVLCGRFIVGVGIGMASMTVPMYLAECAPTHLRGRLTVADNLAVTGGQFTAGVIDYAFSYVPHGWRYMLGVAAIPAIVRFVAFFFLPESPRWLVGRGKVERAKKVLGRVRGEGVDVETELNLIKENLEQSSRENEQSVFRKLRTMLTTRHLLLALIVGCGLQAIQQLSGINTVMYYSPTILRMAGVIDNHKAIGLGAVIAMGNFIFTLIGLYFVEKLGRRKLILSSLAGVIVSLLVLGMAFFLANASSPSAYTAARMNDTACYVHSSCSKWRNCDDCVIDDSCHYCVFNGSFGGGSSIGVCVHTGNDLLYRKKEGECLIPDTGELSYSRGGSNACQSTTLQNTTAVKTFEFCPSDYAWLTLTALVMYIVVFAPGMGPVPWTVNAEIYPNWARSIGNSASSTTNWASNLLVSVTFLHVTRYLTRFGTFWLYAAIAFSGWMFIFFLLPETKGKTLEQVGELFQRPLCPPPGCHMNSMCTKQRYYRLQTGKDKS